MDPAVPIRCRACGTRTPGTTPAGLCASCHALYEPGPEKCAAPRGLPALAPLQ